MSLHWRVLLNTLSLADTRELLEVLDTLQKLVHRGHLQSDRGVPTSQQCGYQVDRLSQLDELYWWLLNALTTPESNTPSTTA